MIRDLSGSWCIKGTNESTLAMDSAVPLIHHDQDTSWITDPDPGHPKGTHLPAVPYVSAIIECVRVTSLKIISSSGIRRTKFISVYKF